MFRTPSCFEERHGNRARSPAPFLTASAHMFPEPDTASGFSEYFMISPKASLP